MVNLLAPGGSEDNDKYLRYLAGKISPESTARNNSYQEDRLSKRSPKNLANNWAIQGNHQNVETTDQQLNSIQLQLEEKNGTGAITIFSDPVAARNLRNILVNQSDHMVTESPSPTSEYDPLRSMQERADLRGYSCRRNSSLADTVSLNRTSDFSASETTKLSKGCDQDLFDIDGYYVLPAKQEIIDATKRSYKSSVQTNDNRFLHLRQHQQSAPDYVKPTQILMDTDLNNRERQLPGSTEVGFGGNNSGFEPVVSHEYPSYQYDSESSNHHNSSLSNTIAVLGVVKYARNAAAPDKKVLVVPHHHGDDDISLTGLPNIPVVESTKLLKERDQLLSDADPCFDSRGKLRIIDEAKWLHESVPQTIDNRILSPGSNRLLQETDKKTDPNPMDTNTTYRYRRLSGSSGPGFGSNNPDFEPGERAEVPYGHSDYGSGYDPGSSNHNDAHYGQTPFSDEPYTQGFGRSSGPYQRPIKTQPAPPYSEKNSSPPSGFVAPDSANPMREEPRRFRKSVADTVSQMPNENLPICSVRSPYVLSLPKSTSSSKPSTPPHIMVKPFTQVQPQDIDLDRLIKEQAAVAEYLDHRRPKDLSPAESNRIVEWLFKVIDVLLQQILQQLFRLSDQWNEQKSKEAYIRDGQFITLLNGVRDVASRIGISNENRITYFIKMIDQSINTGERSIVFPNSSVANSQFNTGDQPQQIQLTESQKEALCEIVWDADALDALEKFAYLLHDESKNLEGKDKKLFRQASNLLHDMKESAEKQSDELKTQHLTEHLSTWRQLLKELSEKALKILGAAADTLSVAPFILKLLGFS